MDISTLDYIAFLKYKGIVEAKLDVPDACLTCDYPELRHFILPKPRSNKYIPIIDPELAPSTPGNTSPMSAPTTTGDTSPMSAPTPTTTGESGSGDTSPMSAPTPTTKGESGSGDTSPMSAPTPTTTGDTSPMAAPIPTTTGESGSGDTSPMSAPTPTTTGEHKGTGCESDENGDYSMTSLSDTSNSYVILYKYNLETQKNGANIAKEVLPFLEKALLDFILPDLFIDQCNPIRSLRQNSDYSRRLSIVGASSKPLDIISTEGKKERLNFQFIRKKYDFILNTNIFYT